MTQKELLKLQLLLAKFRNEYGDTDLLEREQVIAIYQVYDAVGIVEEFEEIAAEDM
jgi:hypothetical protein